MPSTRESLITAAWTTLEGDADVLALFPRAGTRTRPDAEGGLRDRIARAPADFRRLTIDITRGTHSMRTLEKTFAMEDPDEDGSAGTEVERRSELTIVVRAEFDKTGEITAPEEAILTAFLKSGARLGLPDLVLGTEAATFDRRETRRDEKPNPGHITTIRIPILTREKLRDILAS